MVMCVYVAWMTEDGGDDKEMMLEPGEHCLPFSCRLLADLPASFEGQHGCIRYVAKAIIEQPSSSSSSAAAAAAAKSDVVVARQSFTMAPGLNLCFLPEATVSQRHCRPIRIYVTVDVRIQLFHETNENFGYFVKFLFHTGIT